MTDPGKSGDWKSLGEDGWPGISQGRWKSPRRKQTEIEEAPVPLAVVSTCMERNKGGGKRAAEKTAVKNKREGRRRH